jgi:hypothetical protein
MYSNIPIVLRHGLGNKLNFIYNTLHLSNVKYYWVRTDWECRMNHDDGFNFGKTGIDITTITHDQIPSIQPELEFKHFFAFQGWDDPRKELAQQFIKRLTPSKQLMSRFDLSLRVDTGWAVRLEHPHGTKHEPIVIPHEDFLSTDSHKQRVMNPWAIQNHVDGPRDYRDVDNQLVAVADWFVLMNCKNIKTYGTPSTKGRPAGRSTYIDSAAVMDIPIANMTASEEIVEF